MGSTIVDGVESKNPIGGEPGRLERRSRHLSRFIDPGEDQGGEGKIEDG